MQHSITLCVIRKLVHNADSDKRMKLTKKRLIDSLRALEEGKTVYQARKIAGITVRYMYNIWGEYKKTGEIPVKGLKAGKPVKPIKAEQEKIVEEVYAKYRICASRLVKRIKRDYNLHIPVYMSRIEFSKTRYFSGEIQKTQFLSMLKNQPLSRQPL